MLGHVKGEKIRIGKYRRRTGYRRHTGYRSSLSQIEITAIGAKRSTAERPRSGLSAAEEETGAARLRRSRPATTKKEES